MQSKKAWYDLDLAENELCFYHGGLQKSSRPMCFGVSDRALFIARELWLKTESYTMQRIPIDDVKEVVLSRDRGVWSWLKWVLVTAFGVIATAALAIGQWLTPGNKPTIGGIGAFVFLVVGVIMLVDSRWRLVLTIRTKTKDWQWRPYIFDDRNEVKALRENFLAACRYASVPTRRLDLVNENEIKAFWKWFEKNAGTGEIDVATVTARLHKLCDRLDAVNRDRPDHGSRELIITANRTYDAFPILEELVFNAPQMRDLAVTAFMPRREVSNPYRYSDIEFPIDNIFFVPYTDGFDAVIQIYANVEEIPNGLVWSLCSDLLGEYDFVLSVQFTDIKDLSELDRRLGPRHILDLPGYVDDFHCIEP